MSRAQVQVYNGYRHTFTRREFFAALRGRTYHQARQVLGCSYGTLMQALKVFKVRKRGGKGDPGLPLIPREELEPYVRGYSWVQLADMFGRSITSMRRSFKFAKLVKRDERTRDAFFPCRTR